MKALDEYFLVIMFTLLLKRVNVFLCGNFMFNLNGETWQWRGSFLLEIQAILRYCTISLLHCWRCSVLQAFWQIQSRWIDSHPLCGIWSPGQLIQKPFNFKLIRLSSLSALLRTIRRLSLSFSRRFCAQLISKQTQPLCSFWTFSLNRC